MPTDEAFPLWTLVQASHVVTRGFTQVFGSVGLTPSQFGVLAVLDGDPNLTQAELARIVLMRPQSMGELVGSLLERGFVRRDGPGGRGRPSGIALTDAGRELLAEALPRVRAFHAPESHGLTPAQLASLDELLHVVLRTMGVPSQQLGRAETPTRGDRGQAG